MVHGWMRRVSKRLVSRRRKKGEAPTSLSAVHAAFLAFLEKIIEGVHHFLA